MSASEFSAALQSEAYKNWFAKLEKNIVSSTIDKLRTSQQRAAKTDFIVTARDVGSILKSLTGSARPEDVQAMLQKLASNSGVDGVTGSFEKVAGQSAVLYKGISFDTITTVLNRAFSGDEFDHYLYEQTELYKDRLKEEIKNDPTLTKAEYNRELQKIAAIPNFTIGTFFDKGHVVSVAANLSKSFRQEITKSEQLSSKIKSTLLKALDVYIKALEEDDLKTANMPREVYQNIGGVDYTKSTDKYLVEMQYSITNRASGRLSKPIVEELRKIFTPGSAEIEKAFNNSSTGKMLLESKSSPTFLDLLAKDIASVTATGKRDNKVYSGKLTKPVEKKIPLPIKTTNNKKLISSLKKLKSEIAANKPKQIAPKQVETLSLTSLQSFINAHLQDVISANMGDGTERSILNYRTGRFAGSVNVDKLTQSRDGMITAFYSYMKNPYATFSTGGAQSQPTSRDPKLLISRSIREIVAERVNNKLRAVNV